MGDVKNKRGGRREGAGAKPSLKPNKKAKTLNLELETHSGLETLKKRHGKSQAVIVETLVRVALKKPTILD